MTRKRITQVCPFLLPLRQWQRKTCFYLGLRLDQNQYATQLLPQRLTYPLYNTQSLLLNYNSGADMQYQYNKVHNLKLAARTLDGLVIEPGQVFSFWYLVQHADRFEPYKDGLNLVNGKIIGTNGGGMCQLTNLLFWLFLHTPLTVLERHGHAIEAFPSTTAELPHGTDATVSEGWRDLKIKNDTAARVQIIVSFDEEFIYGQLVSDLPATCEYEIFNRDCVYYRRDGQLFQQVGVWQRQTQKGSGRVGELKLYDHTCGIGYGLPEGTEILDYADFLAWQQGEI